jgi:glycosyltransferase involved in cell wall biosynthesis
MAPVTFSCTIIAHNEADRIERCILAVRKIADEIVVIDSGSTDDTVAIAQRLGARVITRAWTGYGQQKRFAEDSARFNWVLNLDADEVVSAELGAEITALMAREPPLKAYHFKQVTVYPGDAKPRLWADYKNQVRLYDRTVVRFHDSLTHDTVDMRDVPAGQLNGVALHYSWRSLEHVTRKLDGYTDLQALEIKKPRWQLKLRQPIEYPYLLFRFYVLRRHFTGGLYGMKVAHTFAAGRAQRIGKFLAQHSGSPKG